MRHATNRVKGFYAKTKKPARLNIFVGLAWRLPRLLSGRRAALRARVTAELKTAANPLPTFNKQLSAFPAHATFSYLPCPGGGMADAEDLKSSGDFSSCGFDSHPGHHFETLTRHFLTRTKRNVWLRPSSRRSGDLGWCGHRQNRFPIQNRIPNEAMIAPIHIPVERIEVKRHDVTEAGRHVQNRGTAQNIFFTPGLPADDKRRARRVSPFEDDPRAVFGPIQAGGAVGHAQPHSGNIVERKILAEDAGVTRVTISDRVIRPSERDAHVCARSAGDGILCCRR